MAVQERSAGVVLFRRRPDGDAGGMPLFLLLDYGRHWDYPKGHVQKGEDDRAAARRELAEEAGITEITWVEGFSHEIVYFFRSKRGLVRKTVVFFLAQTPGQKVTLSDEHVGHVWLTYDAAMKRLTYSSAREVLAEAVEHLRLMGDQ